MFIGQTVLLKHNNEIQEGVVVAMGQETLQVQLKDNTIVERTYWEVRKIAKEE